MAAATVPIGLPGRPLATDLRPLWRRRPDDIHTGDACAAEAPRARRSLGARTARAFAAETREIRSALADPVSRVLIAVFLGLQLLDAVTTNFGLHSGSREMNPVAAAAIGALSGGAGLLALKAGAACAVILTSAMAGRMTHKLLTVAALVSFTAVLWNLLVIS